MTILPKATYRLKVIPVKMPIAFFTELEQIILKFAWKHKKPQRAKTILRKKRKTGDIMLPQNSSVLAQKQTHRSMELNREPRNEPTLMWTINLQQKKQEHTMGKTQPRQ